PKFARFCAFSTRTCEFCWTGHRRRIQSDRESGLRREKRRRLCLRAGRSNCEEEWAKRQCVGLCFRNRFRLWAGPTPWICPRLFLFPCLCPNPFSCLFLSVCLCLRLFCPCRPYRPLCLSPHRFRAQAVRLHLSSEPSRKRCG